MFGCGGSGPEAEAIDAVPSDNTNPTQPIDPVDPGEEVDYQGFTVAPPLVLEDGRTRHSFDEKLSELTESTDVPSTLAGAFFQLGRAYLSGREPITQIEMEAFEIFGDASSETLQALDRTLQRIDELPAEDMATIYNADFLRARADTALTHSQLGNALIEEMKRRGSLSEHGDPDVPLDEEQAGLVRVGDCRDIDAPDGKTPGHCPNICGVKTEAMGEAPAVRTGSFVPSLSSTEYEVRELDGEDASDCRGEIVGSGDNAVCLRIPTVRPEEIVRLEGFNFHDVDAEIQLVPWFGPAVESNVVSTTAHVRGATPTALERLRWNVYVPGDSVSNASNWPSQGNASDDLPNGPPANCGAGDLIHFQVPREIRAGIYRVRVVQKHPHPGQTRDLNNTGDEPFIQVLSPDTTRFTVTAESLAAVYDQSWVEGEWGREELGLRFYLLSDGELGMSEFELGGVEQFDHYCVGEMDDDGVCTPSTLFTSAPGAGIAFAIVGLEIDDKDAYKKNIRDWDALYAMVSKNIYGKVADYVGEGVKYGITALTGHKKAGEIIGKVTTAGIKAGVTLWAPADLVIADRSAFSFSELDALTSPLAPTPRPYEYNVVGKVDVLVEACSNREERNYQVECFGEAKGPGVYREIREYNVGFPEVCRTDTCRFYDGSLHWLNLRYDRVD
jgi:hypothetical protein